MSKASELFNALPFEVKRTAGLVLTEHRIQQIKNNQADAKAAYQKFMRDTNAHIKNLERDLERDLKTVELFDA